MRSYIAELKKQFKIRFYNHGEKEDRDLALDCLKFGFPIGCFLYLVPTSTMISVLGPVFAFAIISLIGLIIVPETFFKK